ncbi:MAG: enoyl-CoA hydratase [Bacteroidota bacterium]
MSTIQTQTPSILREDIGSICRLTLNRPKQYNALSMEVLERMLTQLNDIAQSDSIQVVILSANGKAFCPGHDLKEMREDRTQEYGDKLFGKCSEMMLAIRNLPQPVIAEVQGIATAAGCQLVATCDLAVAADHVKFGVSGINMGLFCSTPSVALSRNVMPKQALEMLLTGEFITAARAREIGLVNRVVPADKLREETDTLAELIAAKAPAAVRIGKDMFYKQLGMKLEDAYTYASERIVCNMLEDDVKEGLDAFAEKRKPIWGKKK